MSRRTVGSVLARGKVCEKLAPGRRPRYTERVRRFASTTLAAALLLVAAAARADRVALLPSRSGDDTAKNALDVELTRVLIAQGHSVVPDQDTKAALAKVGDGVADTNEEYLAVGAATKAQWVVVGVIEPAVVSSRVELIACLISLGRVESVAREVEKARSQQQVQEMTAVLLRPEGIGAGALPWERPATGPKAAAAVPPPAAAATAPPRTPSGKRQVHMDYLFDAYDVWPPYSAGRRWFVTVGQGFSVAAVRPAGAAGSSGSIVAHARGGYALGDAGFELLGQIGGNLAGPRALWLEVGGRWMLTPSVHAIDKANPNSLHGLAFHIGPELTLGGFLRLAGPDVTEGTTRYSSSTTGHFTMGAALDMILSITPSFQVEAQVGDFRWVPTGDGSIVLFGATLGGGLRF